ncbi:hypothetical protein AB0H76_07710 [Nocardia sp. NPDC050712]|uniref:hypothetical protein n=1 Tax=Nocardia sp. NPDC050712 TaxID=3155518 RepID=UPI0033CE44DC
MRKTKSVLLLLVLLCAAGSGLAAAEPEPAPAPAPSTPALAEIILTFIPNGWTGRHDLRPELEIYADGRAIRRPDVLDIARAPDVPPQEFSGTIPPDALRAARAEIRALYDVDLGEPDVKDEGKQIIDLMPAKQGQEMHLILYAPGATADLSPEQQDGRIRFTALYRRMLEAFVQD